LVIQLFLWKSLERRRAVAADYRTRSGAATAAKTLDIMDVNQATVEAFMRRHRAAALIHGHTHRPADHEFELDGRRVVRSVLAQWHEDRGEALVVSNGFWRREPILPPAP
jgi:UDP-2,3-diacylglucosamine hydrolase